MEIIILSGGLGTRLRSVVSEVPKVMAPINGKPFLEYVLDDMNDQGIDRVILATGYKKEYIKDYFGDKYKNIELDYSEEDTPLGTGGAIKKALSKCKDDNPIVMYGDIYTKTDYKDLYENHIENHNDATFSLKYMENFSRYGSVSLKDKRITEFKEKTFVDKGYMNVGIYVLNKNILSNVEKNKPFSLEKEFFEESVNKYNFSSHIYDGIFIDIGIPEDYKLATNIISNA